MIFGWIHSFEEKHRHGLGLSLKGRTHVARQSAEVMHRNAVLVLLATGHGGGCLAVRTTGSEICNNL